MVPILARRGLLILATGGSFVVVGAMHAAAPLIALGVAVVSALLTAYLAFFPVAILLRRRKVELSWWVPPGDQPGGALSVDRPFQIHVALRNHGLRRLRVLAVDILASPSLEVPRTFEALVPSGRQVELVGDTRARAAGYHVLHGAVLRFGDGLGLFDVRAFFPNPIAVKVFPRQAAVRASRAPLRPQAGALHERHGVHQLRRRGLAGELREIRDHAHGDPFKLVAWKATARRQKLMVRDLETEIVVTHQILVDIAGSMRGGAPGRAKLDYAIEAAAALARSALDGSDRVGLVTFDSRVYSELKPAEGHHHYLKLVDRLLETRNVVDEDLTDVTNGELTAAVARYLAHQEGIDTRLPRAPALDDPVWEKIQAGPGGELYDLGVLSNVVGTLLKSMGSRSAAPAWWWSRVHIGAGSDPQMAKLRLFCRLRGIELPYRREHEMGRRAAGLSDAIARVKAMGAADLIIILSDLGGVLEDPEAALESLGLARRAGRQVVALVPHAPAFAAPAESEIGRRVAEVLARDAGDDLAAARLHLARHSIGVLAVGPGDDPAGLAGRLARARAALRRVA